MANNIDFRVKNGLVVATTATVQSTATSTSTTTGALVVTGGVGVGGNLNIGGIVSATSMFVNGSPVITAASAGGVVSLNGASGTVTISVGTDTAIFTTGTTISIWNTSTLQSVTNRGSTTSNAISITNSQTSTSTTTGALTVAGGVGIGGDLYIGSSSIGGIFLGGGGLGNQLQINDNSSIASIYRPNGSIQITGGGSAAPGSGRPGLLASNNNSLTLYGGATSGIILNAGAGLPVTVNQPVTSTSTTTGALQIVGGVGIGGNIAVGGAVITNNIVSQTGTNATIVIDPDGLGDVIFTTGTEVLIYSTATSTSTTTGALTVTGGVGIGGALNVANTSFIAGAQVLTTATVNNFVTAGVSRITAGTDTAISTSSGSITIWNTSTLQTVTERGSSTTVSVSITTSTVSTSTNTGALTVRGGVGIGGALNVASTSFIDGAQILTSATVNNFVTAGVSRITAGTDTAISTSSGQIIIWNTSTLQSVTDRGSSSTNAILITNTQSSTSTATGALIIRGGVGIGGGLVSGGIVTATQISITSNKTALGFNAGGTGTSEYSLALGYTAGIGGVTSGSIVLSAGLNTGVQTATNAGFYVSPVRADATSSATTWSVYYNPITKELTTSTAAVGGGTGASTTGTTTTFFINNSTISTGTNSGALRVVGGVGIGGSVNIGLVSYINNSQIITSSTIYNYVAFKGQYIPRTGYSSSGAITIDASLYDNYVATVTNNSTLIQLNTSTGYQPFDGQKLTIRLTDNGSGYTLNWNFGANNFRSVGIAPPQRTVVGSTIYIGAMYNQSRSCWDLLSSIIQ
jgi:hypothetical protein